MSFEGEGEGQERDLERGEDWGRGTLHLLTKLPFEKNDSKSALGAHHAAAFMH